jgi:hypothetical protein
VLETEKVPTGELDGLPSTTSTRPPTPPAAPEATRASNWSEPVPKLTFGYSKMSPLDNSETWLESTPEGSGSVVVVTVTLPVAVE